MTQIVLLPSHKDTEALVCTTDAGSAPNGEAELLRLFDKMRTDLVGTANFLEALCARLCVELGDGQNTLLSIADS